MVPVAKEFERLGFTILSTSGTCSFLLDHGVLTRQINKLAQGRPHVEDAIKNGQIHLVINTGSGDTPSKDGYVIRRAALKFGIPYVTTAAGALAVSKAVAALKSKTLGVQCIQEYHATIEA
jgi:carbamoyl-phosphate synthase large subunit